MMMMIIIIDNNNNNNNNDNNACNKMILSSRLEPNLSMKQNSRPTHWTKQTGNRSVTWTRCLMNNSKLL